MDHEYDSAKSDAFIEAAKSRDLLTDAQAETLREESARRSLMPAQVAIESGLLSSVEAEIAEAFAHPRDLAPGYELLDVLGYGALGVVYRARQQGLKRDVAIKSIMPDRLIEKNVLARFQQEGTAIGRLQHPNIVSAFDSGAHKHRFYLVMELVRGTDLRMRLEREGALDVNSAISITRQVASGLAHALAHDIIHRDIKPGNLILTDAPAGFDLPPGTPLVKIADFGLARLTTPADGEDATRLTIAGSSMGTPMYCAPEQLSGDPVDHRADIYALGATLLNMLTGKPPFSETKMSKLVTAKLTGKPYNADDLPEDLPHELIELLDQMMAHDAEDRIGDYPTLIQRLDAIQTSDAAGRTRSRHFGFLRTRLGKTVAAGLAVAAGVCLLALAAVPWFTWDPEPRYRRTLQETPLFDGQNVEPWKTHRGLWQIGQDSDKAFVLMGRGAASRELPTRPPGSGDTSAVAFRVAVDLLDAEAAEIHFGFEDADLERSERLVVRYSGKQLVLGRRSGLDGELVVVRPRQMPTRSRDDAGPGYHYLIVERHPDHWFVYLDGETAPFAHAELNAEADNRTMQLVAIGGDVFFSDIAAIDLQPKAPPGR